MKVEIMFPGTFTISRPSPEIPWIFTLRKFCYEISRDLDCPEDCPECTPADCKFTLRQRQLRQAKATTLWALEVLADELVNIQAVLDLESGEGETAQDVSRFLFPDEQSPEVPPDQLDLPW